MKKEKTRLLGVSTPRTGIEIRQYVKPDGERYCTATIMKWKGFKFVSKVLKAQQLYERTIVQCEGILSKLKNCKTLDEQAKILDAFDNIYYLI